MAIVFPASPSVNDTHTEGSITYKWDGDKWIGLGVTPADRLVEGSNSLELDANNDLVYTAPGTLKVNSADASGYVAEFNQTNASNSGQILINSPTDGESRPVLIDMARAGNVQWSLGQGYLDTTDAFHLSSSSLASGFTNSHISVRSGNHIGINKANPVSWGGGVPTIEIKGTADTGGNSTRSGAIAFESGSGSNGYAVLWGQEGGIHIYTSATNRDAVEYSSKFHSDGNLHFASGKGIDFSANANATGMTSELLDDYEEGTWTPGVSFGNNSVGVTYSVQTGEYTKIGRQVTVSGYVTLSNKGTSTGQLRIEGLPFPVRNSSGAYNYQNMFYQNILPSNIHTGHEIMSGGSQWFSPGFFGVDRDHQLNAFEVYTHVRFRRVDTSAYSWCLLFVTSDGGSPPTYTTTFAAVINVPAGGVLGEEIIMPFLNAPGDASLSAGTNQAGVQMLYGAPATDGTATYIGWLSGDGNVGNNGSPLGAIFVDGTQNSNGNIDYIVGNTTPTVGTTYGPVSNTNTGTNIHIAVFRDRTGGWCGPQTGNVGGFVVPNTTQIHVRTVRNSIIGHEELTDVAVVNNTQLGAFSWTYFTDA